MNRERNLQQQKIIYFTIDDAPSCFMRLKVNELYERDIPAIWYCRGEYMRLHLEQVVYAIEKGFIIGNHSYSHPYFSQITLDRAKEEILATEELIEEAYKTAEKKRLYKLFRFPFMDKGLSNGVEHKKKLQYLLYSLGFQKALFTGIEYEYFRDQNLGEDIDAPWTFDGREYALFRNDLMDKYGLYHPEDFVHRMQKADPEKGLGLNINSSNDIVMFHDFESTHHLFSPMLTALLQLKVEFRLPKIEIP